MQSPAGLWATTEAKARDEPVRAPFRLYFGMTYILIGTAILLYLGK